MNVQNRTPLILALFVSSVMVSMPSVSAAREMPPRAISASATCETGQVNGRDGFICQDGNVRYFCTEARTVCWPIIPPGPYHRGDWRAPAVAQHGVFTRATR